MLNSGIDGHRQETMLAPIRSTENREWVLKNPDRYPSAESS